MSVFIKFRRERKTDRCNERKKERKEKKKREREREEENDIRCSTCFRSKMIVRLTDKRGSKER